MDVIAQVDGLLRLFLFLSANIHTDFVPIRKRFEVFFLKMDCLVSDDAREIVLSHPNAFPQ